MCLCADPVRSRGKEPARRRTCCGGDVRSCGRQVAVAGAPGTREAPGSSGCSCPPCRNWTWSWSRSRRRRETRRGAASDGSAPGSCPEAAAHLAPWRPGSDTRRAAVVGRGAALRLESSAAFHSLVIRDGGMLVFADRPRGPPITLRARYILIHDGGELHIGSERCPYGSRATISLYGRATDGAAVEGFGQKFLGVGRGGVLELHGRRPRSWTLLDKTLYPGGLRYGPYSSEKRWGSRGLNLRILDAGTARVLAAARFDTHLRHGECGRLRSFLAMQPPGTVVAAAVGDSASRSLTLETRLLLRDRLGSAHIARLRHRQPWALVGILGGDQPSAAEDKREYHGSGTTGLAVARREFLTYDGTRFTVTAFSGWIKGVPHNGFKVEASSGIILHLVDEVTSWLPGDRIVVASTDYSMHQAEEFNLLPCPECKSNQVKIDGSPLYLHIGEVIDGVDMRAEVGLLTRNILIQGEMEDSCYGQNQCQFFSFDTFGGHIKILRNFSSVHLSGVELKNMGQQILGSYPVHFHLAEDVDERGGYERPTYLDNLAIHHCFSRCVAIHGTHGLLVKDTIGYDTLGHCFFLEDGTEQRNTFYHNLGLLTRPGTILPSDRSEVMCLAIRSHVYGNYVPVPSTDCMAVSTFWIANPNNNLIANAAAGAQDVGIWYIFHRVPTGQSEGQYPEGQAEYTPLGVFHNNRVHSNFKAGLFIGKGVKTTRANAEDPREYLTVDNARFSDNGIGLTLASDGTFPTDEGSSLEVTRSIFVGESSNFGSQGGQNSYWGKGANGEYRTLPRNKTFPIRGFQIYDGPVRMVKCTFKKFIPTVDRYSSAIGFFMKNSWQISPQNNVSQILMEKSVGLKVFFGRSGQWFGNNDNDGDKMSIFHDLDGSVTGYLDTFIGRADNYLLRHPGCLTVPCWNGVMCTGKFAQLYIQARRPENLTLSIARAAYHSHPLRLQGVNRGAPYQQYQPVVMLEQAYIIQWDGRAPEDIILYPINFNRGDWLHVALCYPREAVFQVVADIYQRRTGMVHSVKRYLAAPSRASALNGTDEQLFYFDRASGYLFVHLQAHEAREGHSYCSQKGCERIKIMAHMYPGDSWSCDPNPFLERPAATQRPVSQHPAEPCRVCGAPQLAITSTPSVKYIRIQIQSLSRMDIQNHLTSAFIKINDTVFLFNSHGIFFVVVDACSGAVVSRRHFDTVTGENAASAITDYVQTSIKERSLVLVCSRDIADVMGSSEMTIFTRLGSAKPIVFHKEGSFAMLGYKGQAKPSWIKVLNHAGYRKAASLQHYVPLKLKEYQCPANADESLKFAFSQTRLEHISTEAAASQD
ncbi:cell surface hyaluronidase-like isoform X2 [Strigops habroptila]|uniref:cell surface hyaluronidase-like isoform X2 n=1 Tax=Strigops habroptila TaxID=2489341 RepID=UPI0011CFF1C2|nr:cell surface hyaluronidase-like isoform X2 [Strigops habroptila]